MRMKNKFTALLLVLVLTLAMIPQMPVYAVDNAVKVLGEENLLPTATTVVTIQKSMGDGFAVIEHLALSDVKTGKVVSTDISYKTTATEIKVSIYPHNNFSQNTAYVLKIFTDKNQYNYNLTTEKYVDFSDYETLFRQVPIQFNSYGQATKTKDFYYKRIEVPANPAKGFYFPYFLEVPLGSNGNSSSEKYSDSAFSKYLMVIPNNTGAVNSAKFVEEVMERDIYGNKIGLDITSNLEMPLLLPTFPRPNFTDTYTHMLDEETLFMTKAQSDAFGLGNLVSMDKQLNAMIEDAKAQFTANGVTLQPKIVMNGFSASSDFVQRYSMIYPEKIEAIIHQTTVPVFTLSTYKSKTLNFPLGINDFKLKFGKEFNITAYKAMKQFWYVGLEDHGNILEFRDGFNEEDRNTWSSLFSGDGVVRFEIIKDLYKDYTNTQFVKYENISHNVTQLMELDMANFLKVNLGNDKVTFTKTLKDGNRAD